MEADKLPLPILDSKSIKLLMGPRDPLATPGKVAASGIKLTDKEELAKEYIWAKLEEMLVQEASGSCPVVFKPAVTLYTTENLQHVTPMAIINEPVQVSIKAFNPLHIMLNLKNIYLVWEFNNAENYRFSNDTPKSERDLYVKAHYIKTALLQPNSVQELILAVTPLAIGQLKLKGISYSLISSSTQADLMQVKGKQLFDMNAPLVDLTIKILPPAPCLQIYFSEICSEVLCNEIQKVTVDLRNVSSIPLKNIFLATSVPHLISACEFQTKKQYHFTPVECTATRDRLARKNHVIPLNLPEGQLGSDKCATFNLWLRAPQEKGPAIIDLLIYYENVESNSIPRYRLVRHVWKLSVQESIGIEVIKQKSSTSTVAEKLILSLKVTNLNKIFSTILTEITLLKVALFSSYWFLLKEILVPKKFTLNSQETVYNVIKFKRKIQKDMFYSELPLVTDCCLLEHAEVAFLDFSQRSNQFRINAFDETEAEQAWKSSEAILIVQWQATVVDAGKKRIAYGQSQIAIEEFKDEIQEKSDYDVNFFYDDSKTLQLNNDRKSELVTYNLVHPATLCHSFRRRKMCIVPVKLMLHSVVGDTRLLVTVNTLGAEIG